jgi:hypothetical protein
MPDKLSPEQIKALRKQEQHMVDAIKQSKEQPSPKFGDLQCRADAQKWTSDPFDKNGARNLSINTSIMVNGQFRAIPGITPHATIKDLMSRAYEMALCIGEDAEFEKKYGTYSSLLNAYDEQKSFRYLYFITKHNLLAELYKEDVEENK